MKGNCPACCSHGGVCVLDKGHLGLHDSRYCTWNDSEGLSKEEADALVLGKDPVIGSVILGMEDAFMEES
jgi:hypothetical protein